MFDLDRDYFCRYLSNLDNKNLSVTYKVLECFYDSLFNIDTEAHSIFVDILDEVQIPILEECAKRFSESCVYDTEIKIFKGGKKDD